jgi:hypothetical protein
MHPQMKSAGSTEISAPIRREHRSIPVRVCNGGVTVIIPHSVRRLGLINPYE